MSKSSFHYDLKRIENELVAIEPFDIDKHAECLVHMTQTDRDMIKYIVFPDHDTVEDFKMKFWEGGFSASLEDCLFAVYDKTRTPTPEEQGTEYAGVLSLATTNPTNAATEMGAIIFPAFQRTHVAANAAGLLLFWLLDPPSAGGLGLRRVIWQAHAENKASRRFASRLGFELEGVLRWQRVFPGDKIATSAAALAKRNGTQDETPGRHTALYSIVWDEWDDKRPGVVAQMARGCA